MATTTLTVGVISDTHGLLRPEALDALRGADQILHAGDVGAPDILAALKAIAPTTAVRGNVDHGVWATALPMTDVIRLGDLDVFMLHDLGALDLDPVAAGFAAVITGHSHQPKAEWKRGVLSGSRCRSRSRSCASPAARSSTNASTCSPDARAGQLVSRCRASAIASSRVVTAPSSCFS
jgi:hypothetical protein